MKERQIILSAHIEFEVRKRRHVVMKHLVQHAKRLDSTQKLSGH